MASLSAQVHLDPTIDHVANILRGWPSARSDKFNREWIALQEAGAELVEMTCHEGEFFAVLGADFKRHLRAYGVVV